MGFTPETENEVIWETFPNKLYIPLVNPLNKVWRDSTQTKIETSPFHIGEYLGYTNQGHNEMLNLVDVSTNDTDSIKYRIKFLRVNTIIVTNQFLKSINVPDIGSITIYSEDYINESNNLTQEQID